MPSSPRPASPNTATLAHTGSRSAHTPATVPPGAPAGRAGRGLRDAGRRRRGGGRSCTAGRAAMAGAPLPAGSIEDDHGEPAGVAAVLVETAVQEDLRAMAAETGQTMSSQIRTLIRQAAGPIVTGPDSGGGQAAAPVELEDGLYEELAWLADHHGRSISGQMNRMISRKVQRSKHDLAVKEARRAAQLRQAHGQRPDDGRG